MTRKRFASGISPKAVFELGTFGGMLPALLDQEPTPGDAMSEQRSASLLTRRQFTSALVVAPLIACPICRAAYAKSPWGDKFLCAAADQGAPEEGDILDSSGDPNLDRILAAEMITQSKFFGLRPAFLLYNGANENALATPTTVIDRTQGTILYNLPFLKKQLLSTEWGGTVVSGVIAHEFAHIFQFHSEYLSRLEELHQTVKFLELHADFLSAFYMGRKHVSSPLKLNDYFDEFYNLGDYEFDRKDHHGTKAERYFATKAGYNLALGNPGRDIRFAAAQGETFLKEYFR